MKTLTTIMLCSFLVLGILPSNAGASERFAIRGAGLLECRNFVDERERESPAYLMIGGWIDGYITALNQYRDKTYDITTYESTELIARLIDNHCRNNPGDRLFTVVNSLMARLEDHRVRSPSDLVAIRVGQQATRLYETTIRRIQRVLRSRQYYDGPIDGRFTPPLQQALGRFQQEVGFESNGFPDQATLWFLLGSSRNSAPTGSTDGS